MEPNILGFDVKIEKKEWPFDPDIPKEDIYPLLNNFFGYKSSKSVKYEFFEITRPYFGLVRAVTIIKALTYLGFYVHYVIRILEQPDKNLEISLNLPVYQKQRIEQLMHSLREHYPITHFIETEKYFIILQEFIFFPVCQFMNLNEIVNLLKVIQLASESRILLDFNQNHWLFSKHDNLLYYVDLDYMGDFYSNREKALEANLNQSMSFFNLKNCKFLKSALGELSKQGINENYFVFSFKSSLKTIISESRKKSDLSKNLKQKLECLSLVFGE